MAVKPCVSDMATITVHSIECKDLLAADKKTSDPYVKVALGAEVHKTSHVSKTLAPKFKETLVFGKKVSSSAVASFAVGIR